VAAQSAGHDAFAHLSGEHSAALFLDSCAVCWKATRRFGWAARANDFFGVQAIGFRGLWSVGHLNRRYGNDHEWLRHSASMMLALIAGLGISCDRAGNPVGPSSKINALRAS